MSLLQSIKMSEQAKEFLKNLGTNRRKIDMEDRDLSYWKLINIIVKYFKNNNDRYLELVNTPEDKNA